VPLGLQVSLHGILPVMKQPDWREPLRTGILSFRSSPREDLSTRGYRTWPTTLRSTILDPEFGGLLVQLPSLYRPSFIPGVDRFQMAGQIIRSMKVGRAPLIRLLPENEPFVSSWSEQHHVRCERTGSGST
jgi:hypothetical protein